MQFTVHENITPGQPMDYKVRAIDCKSPCKAIAAMLISHYKPFLHSITSNHEASTGIDRDQSN